MVDRSTRILVAVDASNFEYMCSFSAASRWERLYPEEAAAMLTDRWKTDQDNVPDLLVSNKFRKTLSFVVQEHLEGLDRVIRTNHPEEIESATGVDYVFAIDSDLNKNFRKIIYPGYKAQRKLRPLRYRVDTLNRYIQNVIFKELGLEELRGYKLVKIDGCECDDIIATLMNGYRDYMLRILFSSDHDFLQLEDVHQYNCWGKKLERTIKDVTDEPLSRSDYLLWKIVRGDLSDNIKNVFPKYGDKKSLGLVRDRDMLRKMLNESNDAAERFKLNMTLIDFRKIPQENTVKIKEILDRRLNEIEDVPEFSLDDSMVV